LASRGRAISTEGEPMIPVHPLQLEKIEPPIWALGLFFFFFVIFVLIDERRKKDND
jgi:hypothetical protein